MRSSFIFCGLPLYQQERDKAVLETLELFHKIMFTTLKCQKAAFWFPQWDPLPTGCCSKQSCLQVTQVFLKQYCKEIDDASCPSYQNQQTRLPVGIKGLHQLAMLSLFLSQITFSDFLLETGWHHLSSTRPSRSWEQTHVFSLSAPFSALPAASPEGTLEGRKYLC